MSFGEEVRRIRRNELKITLDELSERSGLSKGFLSKIENDKQDISRLDNIRSLANGLDVPYPKMLEMAGYIEEAEKEGLMKSAGLYKKYRQKKNTDLKEFYKANRFDIEELLSYDTKLLYRSVILSNEDKDKILTFIRDILLNVNKDGE